MKTRLIGILRTACGLVLVAGCSAPSVGGQDERSAPLATAGRASAPPIFGYWDDRYAGPAYPWITDCDAMGPLRFVGPTDFVPIAFPGGTSGLPAEHPFMRCHFERLIEAGAPIAIMLTPGNAPITPPGVTRASPETLSLVIDLIDELGGTLDYVFFDLEGGKAEIEHPRHGITLNIRRAVEMVRSHQNPRISGARIGNYVWSAASFDRAMSFSSGADLSHVADAYLASGVDVSMPSCYPYSWRRTHVSPESREGIAKGLGRADGEASVFMRRAPTVRAALLWGPLERLSAAARALPDGHLLIPWFSHFIAWTGYPIAEEDLPTQQDCQALAVHARLRGAHSIMVLPPSYEAQDNKEGRGGFRVRSVSIDSWRYRELVLDAWGALDTDFMDDRPHEFLRLETDKSSGMMVSAVRFGDEVIAAVSNLSGERREIDVGALLGVRFVHSGIAGLDHGGHTLVRAPVRAEVRDFDGDGVLTRRDRESGDRRIADAIRSGVFRSMFDVNGDGEVDRVDLLAVRNARAAYGPLPE